MRLGKGWMKEEEREYGKRWKKKWVRKDGRREEGGSEGGIPGERREKMDTRRERQKEVDENKMKEDG